jgi:hypothetical protein
MRLPLKKLKLLTSLAATNNAIEEYNVRDEESELDWKRKQRVGIVLEKNKFNKKLFFCKIIKLVCSCKTMLAIHFICIGWAN